MRNFTPAVRSALVAFIALATVFLLSTVGILNANDVWGTAPDMIGARLLYGLLIMTFAIGVMWAGHCVGKAWAERSSGVGYFTAVMIAVHVVTWGIIGVYVGYVSYQVERGGAFLDVWPIMITALLISAVTALVTGIATRLSMIRQIS